MLETPQKSYWSPVKLILWPDNLRDNLRERKILQKKGKNIITKLTQAIWSDHIFSLRAQN